MNTKRADAIGPLVTAASIPYGRCVFPTGRRETDRVVALCTWAPEDWALGVFAPLALAAACDTALVIDLDPGGPRYANAGSLERLVRNGPRAADLMPRRAGMALLCRGDITAEEAGPVIDALTAGWPNVVFRTATGLAPSGCGVVQVRPLLPGSLLPPGRHGAVFQTVGLRAVPPSGSIVLPVAPRATLRALARGERPRRDRWIRAWRHVWDRRWA